MATTATILEDQPANGNLSAVSWPAIFAGATAAAALSLILLVLGTGLGLSAVSPWAERGVSAEAISWSSILWIAFTAVASSGLGGYIAGRLRVRWPSVHTDEVYFRDTAHGFLAWGVATLLTAALLTSAIGTILSVGTAGAAAAGAAKAGGQATAAATAAPGAQQPAPQGAGMYLVDTLLRATGNATAATQGPAGAGAGAGGAAGAGAAAQNRASTTTQTPAPDTRGEITRIFDNGLQSGELSAEDTSYAAQLVSQRTGLSQQEAQARVTTSYDSARQKLQDAEAAAKALAERARKEATYASLWIFVSLLLGAFMASLTATLGGRRRDLY